VFKNGRGKATIAWSVMLIEPILHCLGESAQ